MISTPRRRLVWLGLSLSALSACLMVQLTAAMTSCPVGVSTAYAPNDINPQLLPPRSVNRDYVTTPNLCIQSFTISVTATGATDCSVEIWGNGPACFESATTRTGKHATHALITTANIAQANPSGYFDDVFVSYSPNIDGNGTIVHNEWESDIVEGMTAVTNGTKDGGNDGYPCFLQDQVTPAPPGSCGLNGRHVGINAFVSADFATNANETYMILNLNSIFGDRHAITNAGQPNQIPATLLTLNYRLMTGQLVAPTTTSTPGRRLLTSYAKLGAVDSTSTVSAGAVTSYVSFTGNSFVGGCSSSYSASDFSNALQRQLVGSLLANYYTLFAPACISSTNALPILDCVRVVVAAGSCPSATPGTTVGISADIYIQMPNSLVTTQGIYTTPELYRSAVVASLSTSAGSSQLFSGFVYQSSTITTTPGTFSSKLTDSTSVMSGATIPSTLPAATYTAPSTTTPSSGALITPSFITITSLILMTAAAINIKYE